MSISAQVSYATLSPAVRDVPALSEAVGSAIARPIAQSNTRAAGRRATCGVRAAILYGLAALAAAGVANPATAAVFGSLGNFDVVNDTGKTAYGFEIDMQGISVSDVTDTFGGVGRYFPPTVERYGAPTVSAIAGGVKIVYQATNTGGVWSASTPTVTGTFGTGGESCWTGGGIGYGASTPCDHFGVGTKATPTQTTYSWLVDPTLTPVAATLPVPVMTVTIPSPSPAVPAPLPHVQAVVQSPDPVGPLQFGTAMWVKVYTTQYDHPVALEDLMGNNGIVPQQQSETEIEWQLLQTEVGHPLAGLLEKQGDAAANNQSVLRRYEFYKYSGTLDAEGQVTSETPTVDANNIPLAGGNIGAFIGDQNLAVNLNGVYAGSPVIAAPEPAGIALLATGLIGLIPLRRRHR